MLLAIYLAVGTLAATCKTDGNHTATCASGKCEVIGSTEVCTQCKAGGVPVDGLCRPSTSPQATAAGCTGDASAGVCKACSGGFFLFMGGCYDARAAPGSGACSEARDGACVGYVEEVSRQGKSLKAIDRQTSGTCPEANSGASQTGQCKNGKCDIWIGGGDFCSQCSQTTDYLINGKCTADNTESACEGSASNGMCTSCKSGYFLHRGGCYQIGTEPGNLVCKDTTASSTQGMCDECQAGYFKNPVTVLDKTKQSCIACNQTTAVDYNTGVANCAECTAPATSGSSGSSQKATCTKCASPKYLKTDGTCGESSDCTSGTEFAKVDPVNGNKCVLCGNQTDGIADCKTCSKTGDTLKCSACNKDKKPNTAGTACVACNIANCASCDKENVCEMCTNSKKLSPLKDACLTACPAGTYDDNSICKPCHTSCSSCSDAASTSCTACYPGSVLSKSDSSSTGTCIPECTGRYAENCEADQCTAVLGGSKYCSRCKRGFVPVDGLCVSARVRALTGCTSKGDGTCSACTGTHFLQSGGCYNTKALPGSAVCTAVTGSNGECKTCANGQTYASGNCPACAEGCAKCATDTSTCTECLAGYYLDSTASKCVKCSENSADGNIKGVPNCVSCAAPSNGNGAVTCYVTQQSTDPSVNKGGLSTGAIAGISVAVIVVVGGLVGFLCWWFLCRGKA